MLKGNDHGSHSVPDMIKATSIPYRFVAIFSQGERKPLIDVYIRDEPIHDIVMFDGKKANLFIPSYHTPRLHIISLMRVRIAASAYQIAARDHEILSLNETTDHLFGIKGDDVMALKQYIVYINKKRTSMEEIELPKPILLTRNLSLMLTAGELK